MGLSQQELERISDDVYKNRRITASTFCGNCGYNLRTLPYVYTCPECGQSYNARPLVMKGIFVPYEVEIPWADFLGGGVFLSGAAWWGIQWYLTGNAAYWVVAVLFLGVSGLFGYRAQKVMGRLLKARWVARRIALEEEP
jgi:hypothetical protein